MLFQTLTLNDGTEITECNAIVSDNVLWLYVYSAIDFGELFNLLNDPEKVKKITAADASYRGFKELFCIRKEVGGFITAGLRK